MLTEKEKEWLEDRAENLEIFGGYFCLNCPELVLEEGIMYCGRGGGEPCTVDNPHKFIFKDAAEFEARVAAMLTSRHNIDRLTACDGTLRTCHSAYLTCRACRLKHARLAVEAKMEAGNAGR
jgi:hypothetical protein